MKWTKQSEVEEVKWIAVLGMGEGGGERVFMEKFYRVVSDEKCQITTATEWQPNCS